MVVVIFHSKIYQNNIFIFIIIILKKFTSAHQNDQKTPKNINLK